MSCTACEVTEKGLTRLTWGQIYDPVCTNFEIFRRWKTFWRESRMSERLQVALETKSVQVE